MLRRRRRHSPPTTPPAAERPRVVGKFLQVGDERLLIRGVTYGTFAPDAEGVDYPAPEVVDRDFAGMAAAGFTTLRTYTVPPRALLDLAERHGLRVLVGLPWEQHIAFLDDHGRARAIERTIREGVRSCAGHPAVLAFAIGNEIPASIVRWLGRERVEDFLERLYRAAKDEDPGALVTYVNFPTTEYLQLPFLDFCAFNVYLERQDDLAAYLARLQVLADDRPLVMAEIGLDSRRNGEDVQAEQIRTQLGTVFGAGCAGAFVFAWTDEWYRGGHDIDDWDFGLTRRDRSPKPALEVVAEAMRHVPPQPPGGWPSITAVVCSYNGAKTIDGCLRALRRVDYPDLEILVIDDGSGDGTAAVAEAHGVRVITTENRGLSAARNTGAREARGEIVAYVDDDAMPVSTWARYLGRTFATTAHAAVGGPNVPPEGGKNVARAVSSAPGGPIHVLLDDEIAEHVPGCNLAVRRDALLSIGGFDEQFRIAGDDVDLCWRIQEAGWTVGFSPAAVVLHHRRGSVPGFWRQQRGYGRAEGMLERAWPQKYNRAGHVTWHGRIYGPGPIHLLQRWRVYYGTWGSGAFQGLYRRDAPQFTALPLMPEWYLVIAILAGLTALGASWRPLLAAGPLLVLAVVLLLAQAMIGAARARLSDVPSRRRRLRIRAICTLLYLCQAAARLQGRIEFGLAPWGRRARPHARLPFPRRATLWSERWRSAEDRVQTLHDDITATGVRVRPGGDFDRWDLEVRGGGLGSARLLLAVEEHGSGKQLIRVRTRPRMSPVIAGAIGVLGGLAAGAAVADARIAAAVLGAVALILLLGWGAEAGAAAGAAITGTRMADRRERLGGDPLASVPHVSLRRRLGLLRYLRPHLVGVGVLLATVVLVSLLALAVPWPIKIVVDNVLGTVPPGPLLEALPGPETPEALLVAAVAMAVLIFIATTAVELVQSYLNVRVGQRVTYALAADVFAHVQRLSLVFHGRRPVGDTIARVNQDTFGLQSMLVGVGVPIAQSLVTLVAMFTIMYVLSPELTLLALAVVPLQLLAIAVFAQPMKRASRDRLDREGRLVSVVQQTLTSLPAVQAFTRERVEHARFVRDADHTLAAYMRETLAGMWFKLVVGAATAAGTAAIMYLGAKQALDGDLSTGTIIVFLAYLAALYAPLDSIAYTASSFQSAAAQCDRVIEILDSRPDVEDAPHADEAPIAAGHVRYEGVSFGYDPTRLALQDIDVEARPGEVIAIVGPTGAGKTTLVSLLVRFFDPQRGRITIDGRDVHAWKARALREQIGLVLQEPFILPLTAAENIAYGRPDASREDIVEAARAADAHDFIERLPQGYDTVIGERGATLSGGEKQRLSIARAFLKDARILILDEPTSALDARTEAALLDALQRLSAGRTSFVIAHRLSTIRGADRILVVDGGRIVDQGSHGELVARGGLYAELYAQQMDFTRHDVAPGALLSAPAPAQRFHRDPVEG